MHTRHLVSASLSPCTTDNEGLTIAHNGSDMMSDYYNVPIAASSSAGGSITGTHGAMTSYHIMPLDRIDTSDCSSTYSRLPKSLDTAGDACFAISCRHDIPSFMQHYSRHHLEQTNDIPHIDVVPSIAAPISHATVAIACSSVSPFADANPDSDFLTGPSHVQGDDPQATQWLNHIQPTQSTYNSHIVSTNSPQYKMFNFPELGVAKFYCVNLLSGDWIGPVDVSEVENYVIRLSTDRLSGSTHGEPLVCYSDDTGR